MNETQSQRRVIGLLPLILSGITCIIGSGWLFGVATAANEAGPASIFSWIIGGIAVTLIALTIAEMGAMFPRSGGMIHYLYQSHGPMAGFFGAWINWIAITPVITTEAVASTQYLSSWKFQWTHSLYNSVTGNLTSTGLIVASILIIVYFLLNYYSIKILIKAIKYITYIKLIVPILTIIILFIASFHPENFSSTYTNFAPFGWSSVLSAISTCGIIYTFNGFQTPVNLAGEVKNPGRNLPIALISSIAICLVLYVLLQIAFIGALSPQDVMNGWKHLSFRSPFAEIAIALNLHVLLIFIYVDAFISPSGVGLTYFTTTSRMLYGMSHNRQMPVFLGKLNKKTHLPGPALITILIVCFIFLFLFKSWEKFAGILSVAEVISYFGGPISLMALRKSRPSIERPFRLPMANFFSMISFIVCGLLLYWSTWPLSGEVIILGLVGFIFYIYYQGKEGWYALIRQVESTLWIIVFLISVAIVSYMGSSSFGGHGYISSPWDQVLIIILSIIFYYWGINSSYKGDLHDTYSTTAKE